MPEIAHKEKAHGINSSSGEHSLTLLTGQAKVAIQERDTAGVSQPMSGSLLSKSVKQTHGRQQQQRRRRR